MNIRVESLGVMSRANQWTRWMTVTEPGTGRQLALGLPQHGGFVLLDPATRVSRIVGQERKLPNAWAVAQAPDGTIYTAGVASNTSGAFILQWDWKSPVSTVAAEKLPCLHLFTIDAAPDGRVYLPNYKTNTLFRYDPATRQVEAVCDFNALGEHSRNIACASDGFVYATCTDYKRTVVAGYDPAAKRVFLVTDPKGVRLQGESLVRDSNGRVLVVQKHWGRAVWVELKGGMPEPLDPALVGLNAKNEPLAFRDGGYVSQVEGQKATVVDANGLSETAAVPWPEEPLRLFSVAEGGGKIWGSTFIPLTLFSYDPAAGVSTAYGNPTATNGEIYSMAFAAGKLFIAAYYGAYLSRFDPGRPWKFDQTSRSNPANLGQMKAPPMALHRPYGSAIDKAGRVFFSALGGYGCEDSGLSRIEPVSEEVTTWIFPDTTFGPIVYLPERDQILVGELRKGEKVIRFTFLSPHTGEVVESVPAIEDEGMVTSWLYEGGDRVYGLHNARATMFAYSLAEKRVVAKQPELGFGHHCYNCLVAGPDGRLWGLTRECVFAVDREMKGKERLADYPDYADGNFYRFGLAKGADGCFYFVNGSQLMKVVT
jgi:streptogramin lyase